MGTGVKKGDDNVFTNFNKNVYIVLLILILFTSACVKNKDKSPIIKEQNKLNSIEDYEVRKAVMEFTVALKNSNAEKLRGIISPKGLIIIRNFVTGGFGVRGKDIRDNYLLYQIPNDLKFPVEGEIPVEPIVLFKRSISADVSMFSIEKINDLRINFRDGIESGKHDPSTSDVRNLISIVLIKHESNDIKSNPDPKISILGDKEFVLSEAILINELPIGVFAIFEKYNNKYVLRAIIDFR